MPKLNDSTFIVSAATYATFVEVLGIDTGVDYRREYEVELDGIKTEQELLNSLSKVMKQL